MNDLVDAYIEFLLQMKGFEKPEMPKFDQSAYTENEYINLMKFIEEEYKYVDDLQLSLDFLKGE